MRIREGDAAFSKTEDFHLCEACDMTAKQGVRMIGGGFECAAVVSGETCAELVTGAPHDFEMAELNPPDCLYRLFRSEKQRKRNSLPEFPSEAHFLL